MCKKEKKKKALQVGALHSNHSCKVRLVLLAPDRTLLGNTAEQLKNTDNR